MPCHTHHAWPVVRDVPQQQLVASLDKHSQDGCTQGKEAAEDYEHSPEQNKWRWFWAVGSIQLEYEGADRYNLTQHENDELAQVWHWALGPCAKVGVDPLCASTEGQGMRRTLRITHP